MHLIFVLGYTGLLSQKEVHDFPAHFHIICLFLILEIWGKITSKFTSKYPPLYIRKTHETEMFVQISPASGQNLQAYIYPCQNNPWRDFKQLISASAIAIY